MRCREYTHSKSYGCKHEPYPYPIQILRALASRWIGQVNAQSCLLINFQYRQINLQFSWLSVEQPIRIDWVLNKHHLEFPINKKTTSISIFHTTYCIHLSWNKQYYTSKSSKIILQANNPSLLKHTFTNLLYTIAMTWSARGMGESGSCLHSFVSIRYCHNSLVMEPFEKTPGGRNRVNGNQGSCLNLDGASAHTPNRAC